jgi:hypothetical protein
MNQIVDAIKNKNIGVLEPGVFPETPTRDMFNASGSSSWETSMLVQLLVLAVLRGPALSATLRPAATR